MKPMMLTEFNHLADAIPFTHDTLITKRIRLALKEREALIEARGLLLKGIGMKTSDSRFECGSVYALGWAQGLFWQSRHGGDPKCEGGKPAQDAS